MLGELRKLLRETAVYGLSTVVARLLNVLLVPLYTHALAPAEYGLVGLVFSYIGLLTVLYSYGMDFAYMRHASDSGGKAFPTAFWMLAGSALGLSSLLHAFAAPLGAAAGLPPEQSDLVRYAAWILAFDALALVPFAALRLTHRAGTYAAIKMANIVLNLTLTYVFLVHWHMGVRGVFLASLITASATLAILAPAFVGELEPIFDRALAARLLRFALPLLPAAIASMAVHLIDRPILKFLTDDATVGVYQANYRLGVIMMMVVSMFDQAWRPFFLQRAEHPEGPRILARVMTYFTAGGLAVFLSMSLFIAHIVALPLLAGRPLIHPAYWGGLSIVPVITLGYVFNGLYVNLLAPVTLGDRTERVALATGAGALVNVAANFVLIPRFGMLGAAWAMLAAYAAMALSLYLAGRRLYPVPYEGARLLHAALCASAVVAAAAWLGVGLTADRAWLRAGLLAAYPALLVATGFLNAEERQELRRRLVPG